MSPFGPSGNFSGRIADYADHLGWWRRFRNVQPRIDEVLQFPKDRVRISCILGELPGYYQGVSFVPVLGHDLSRDTEQLHDVAV
jgi:hypothetical protein